MTMKAPPTGKERKKMVSKKSKMRKPKKMPKSSSSNPASMKFREAAKHKTGFGLDHLKRLSQVSTKSADRKGLDSHSELTLEALERHNEEMGGFTESMIQDDKSSVGGTTFNTWATNLTGCTNATFNRVHRYINSNSTGQKEILAVLAAITEVIKEKGGEGKDVQYFGVLVSSLHEADKSETQMAMAHLLSIVIRKVPVAVLQSRFSQVLKTLMGVVTDCAKQDVLSPLKPCLSCIASLLRVQLFEVWADSSTEHAFRALLAFIIHKKPKLRKAAQRAVKIILCGSLFMQQEKAPKFHPAASITAQHCLKEIESSGGLTNKVDMLHVMALLKDIMGIFPQSHAKSLCEVLLRLMTLTDLVIRSSCMEVLHRFFASKPTIKTMPSEMNAQIITAFYDYQPSSKDSQPMIAWLRVMESALVCLSGRDLHLSMSHLPRMFSTCMTCLLSDKKEIASASVSCMKALLQECVAPMQADLKSGSSSSPLILSLQKVVKAMETGLSYQFHSMWSQVLQLWATGYSVIGKIAPDILMKCLSSMGDLRDTPHFSYKGEMDHAIGNAVKSMGPRKVLEAIPLGITGEDDNLEFPRGWLLPLIRDNVTNTELGFFTSYFLPLAAKFKSKADACASQNRLTESKSYDAMQLQIWAMLKGFCDNPTDLKQSFQGIAKILGTALNDRQDLRMDVMSALRSLISCCLDKEEDKKEVARFAKNYLPILFNQYTSEGLLNDWTRQAVLETTKKYLLVSDTQLIGTFIDKCLTKLQEEDVNSFRNIALLDLATSMIPYSDLQRLKKLFNLTIPKLQSEDRTVQKKSYRLLEAICGGDSANCEKLVASNLNNIRDKLLSSLSKSGPSAKAPRLRCLIHVFKKLNENSEVFLMAVLPEAILCTKEIGVKARAASFDLIVAMSEACLRWNEDKEENDVLDDFISKICAGLAGSPHMISATLLALTRIVFHYKTRISGSVLDYMVENVCILLASKTREVIKTALGFIKVLLSAYENITLAAHLKRLLEGLHDIALKGNMRRLTKIVYLKLMKKFGYEVIVNMTDQKVHKLLKNIHKAHLRSKRKADEDDSEEDEDEDGVEEKPMKSQPESIDEILQDTDSEMDDDDADRKPSKKSTSKKKKQSGEAWLMETGEDEIVDFMDPSAAKQVLGSKPKLVKVNPKEKDRGFKMTPDGRLVITADDDEDEEKTKKTKGKPTDSDAEDDLEDLLATLEGGVKSKSRKRKRGAPDDGEDEDEVSAPKYKAGGHGIHRPMAKVTKQEFGEEYKSKKAAGDVKKAGKPDPYAYVPLNFGHLNKRKQLKVKGAFKNLVKGAKKGAAKGVKRKMKGRRK